MTQSALLCAFSIIFFYIALGTIAEPQFEIREGNCSKAALNDLALQKNVHLTRLPFVRREAKAYVKSFSAALRFEYGNAGITIQHLAPMFVNTKMNNFSDKLRKTSFLVPDAQQYARYAVSTLGKTNSSSGYWTHGIQTFFTKMAPVWMRMYIGGYMNLSFRKDYFEQRKKDNNNTEYNSEYTKQEQF